ncbi:Uncharacterised protein [Streptococcus pneumoniae]|nr:Uncharacterised protein [Streptococcus pneumoniae]
MTKRCSRFQYNGRFQYLLQAGEDRYFLGQRLPHGQRRFLYLVQKVPHRFPRSCPQLESSDLNPLPLQSSGCKNLYRLDSRSCKVFQQGNQTIQGLSKAHKPK